MAYIVKDSNNNDITEEFRKKEYAGSSTYRTILKIDGVEVPNSQISKIVISSPIIDDRSDTFYVGSFISQQITITFRNLDGLNIESNKEVTLDIGQIINGEYVYIPIGKYLIDDLGENYQTKCEITCLDYAVKFKQPVNYQPYMTNGRITIDEILTTICNICNVELDSNYPKTNGNITTGYVDSTISGKEYISYIAEIKGCNAKIGRDGKLYLRPLNSQPATTINALKSKSWELGEKYKITHVTYFDGVPNLWSFPKDTTLKENELFLRQSNPFITEESIVENVYNLLKDTTLYTIKNENYGDITLDSWDTIKFTLGEEEYTTLNNNTLTYQQNIMTKIDTKIPTKQQETAVNIKKEPEEVFKRTIKATIDTINSEINTTIENVNENKSEITNIKQSLDGLQIDFSKSGNNLIRNTMFYDFEGWSWLGQFNITRGETPPTDIITPYWYCTKTSANYENGIVYNAVYENDEFSYWQKTDIKISNLEESFPITTNWNILYNEETKNKYLSGRSIHAIYDYEASQSSMHNTLNSDLFDIVNLQEYITVSFKTTSNLKNGGMYAIGIWLYEDTYNSYYISQPMFSIIFQKNMNNELIKHKFKIPKSSNTYSVYKSSTEPTDKTVAWLKEYEYYYKLNRYNGTEWEEIAIQDILKDQNNKLYFPSYQIIYLDDEIKEMSTYYGITYNDIWKESFEPKVGALDMNVTILDNEITGIVDMEIGDLKLEYGDYSEWTPKRSEVIGLTHLLDETGYKIHSGDDTMRIMVDEIAQYYKDEKTFYINKTTGYFKDAKSDTNDINGLVTRKFNVNSIDIYGRYIK